MTVRENVHQLVDTLPQGRLADVFDYLADLNDTDDISRDPKPPLRKASRTFMLTAPLP